MANVLNRTTLQYLEYVNTPDYDHSEWIINPDLANVQNMPPEQWVINSDDTVRPMTNDEINSKFLSSTILTKQTAADFYYKNTILNNGWMYSFTDSTNTVHTNLYDCDPTAQSNVNAMVTSAVVAGSNFPSDFVWRTKTNDYVPMSGNDVIMFGLAMMTYVTTCMGLCWRHKDILKNMTDVTTINEYDFTAGYTSIPGHPTT